MKIRWRYLVQDLCPYLEITNDKCEVEICWFSEYGFRALVCCSGRYAHYDFETFEEAFEWVEDHFTRLEVLS